MKHLRLAILISGGGRTMENLAQKIAAKELDAEIVTVIASNAHCAGIERAKKLGLPVHIVTRKDHGQNFSNAISDLLHKANPDLVLMAGFLSLWQIPPDFTGRVMNIHPALLPKFGGKGMHGHHVHQAILAAKETESGCTVHFADNHYDNGPIILQKKVPVLPADTPDTLAARVFTAECEAYPEAIRQYQQNLEPQNSRKSKIENRK